MKKFEEEFDKNVTSVALRQDGESVITVCDYNEVKAFGDGWVTPEDHKNTVASNKALEKSNLKMSEENAKFIAENIELTKKIADLKSQLEKQQPEIPECVAEFIENYDDINETSLLYIMKDFVESKHWDVFCKIPDDLKKYGRWDDMLYKAIRFGYTVAKEKRFYLKHIDFCKRDKDYDWYMIKHSDGPLNHLRVEKGTLPPTVDTYFIQQEIDSMETGSYDQVEVEE